MLKFNSRNLATLAFIVALCNSALPAMSATDTDGDGIPDAAEPVLGTDPMNADTDGDGVNDLADKQPLVAANPIAQTGNQEGFTFTAKVEDNFDLATKKDVPDHLELKMKNTSGEALNDLVIFYSMKDDGTGKIESYYKPLPDITVKAGKTITLNFDDTGLPGHFRDNPNSGYHMSQNAKTFTVQLAAAGYAPVQIEFKKDKGGAEQAD